MLCWMSFTYATEDAGVVWQTPRLPFSKPVHLANLVPSLLLARISVGAALWFFESKNPSGSISSFS